MTQEQLRDAFAACRRFLNQSGYHNPVRNTGAVAGSCDSFNHLLWLCVEGPLLVDRGRVEKAHRWLGFVQGALWRSGLASIETFKDMNRAQDAGASV